MMIEHLETQANVDDIVDQLPKSKQNFIVDALRYTQQYYNNQPYIGVITEDYEYYIGEYSQERTDTACFGLKETKIIELDNVREYVDYGKERQTSQTEFQDPFAVVNPILNEIKTKHSITVEETDQQIELENPPADRLQRRMEKDTYPYAVEYSLEIGDKVYDTESETIVDRAESTIELTKEQLQNGYIGADRYLPKRNYTYSNQAKQTQLVTQEKIPNTPYKYDDFQSFKQYISSLNVDSVKNSKMYSINENKVDILKDTCTAQFDEFGLYLIFNQVIGIEQYNADSIDISFLVGGKLTDDKTKIQSPIILMNGYTLPLGEVIPPKIGTLETDEIRDSYYKSEMVSHPLKHMKKYMLAQLYKNYNSTKDELELNSIVCRYEHEENDKNPAVVDVIINNEITGHFNLNKEWTSSDASIIPQQTLANRCEMKQNGSHHQLFIQSRLGDDWYVSTEYFDIEDDTDVFKARTHHGVKEYVRASVMIDGVDARIELPSGEDIEFTGDESISKNDEFIKQILKENILPPTITERLSQKIK